MRLDLRYLSSKKSTSLNPENSSSIIILWKEKVATSYERSRDECFGLPCGGAIFGLLIGAIIIIWGLQQLFGWDINIGPFDKIIEGILITE